MTSMSFETAERFVRERPVSALAMSAFLLGGFMALHDGTTQARSQELDEPTVIYRRGAEGSPFRIVLFPGSCTNVEEIEAQAGRLFEPYGSLYIVEYQKQGFEHEALKPAIVQKLDQYEGRDGGKQTVFMSQSFGGPVENVLMSDPVFRHRIGEVAMDIEDSPLFHPNDLTPAGRFGSEFAGRLPVSRTTEFINRQVMRFAARNGIPFDSELVNKHEAKHHALSTAETPFAARKGQIRFLNRELKRLLHVGAFASVRDPVRQRYVLSTKGDYVVKPRQAAERLARLWGSHVLHLEQTNPEGEHAVLFEFPRLAMEVLEGKYADMHQSGKSFHEVNTEVVAEAEVILAQQSDQPHHLTA